MNLFALGSVILSLATQAAAQSATITGCVVSTVTSVRTQPTSCPSCSNTIDITATISSSWSLVSSKASSFSSYISSASAAGATPDLNDVQHAVISAFYDVPIIYGEPPTDQNTGYQYDAFENVTCFNEAEASALLKYTTDVVNTFTNLYSVEQMFVQWYSAIDADNLVIMMQQRLDRLSRLLTGYFSRARGCFDCSDLSSLDSQIANIPWTRENGVNKIYYSCSGITVYSPVFGQCGSTSSCGLLTITTPAVSQPACSSCSVAESARSTISSGLSAFNSIHSAIIVSALDPSVAPYAIQALARTRINDQFDVAMRAIQALACQDSAVTDLIYDALAVYASNSGIALDNSDLFLGALGGLDYGFNEFQGISSYAGILVSFLNGGCTSCLEDAAANVAIESLNQKLSTIISQQSTWVLDEPIVGATLVSTITRTCELVTTTTNVPCSSSASASASVSSAVSSTPVSAASSASESAASASVASSGYSNSSTTATESTTKTNITSSTTASSIVPGSASTHTFTTTTLVTEPCDKCPGGSTTYTSTAVVTEPCETSAASTRTFTSTAVVTEPGDATATATLSATPLAEGTTTSAAAEGTATHITAEGTAAGTTTHTVTGVITKTAVVSTSASSTGSVSVAAVPEAGQTSVVAANAANKKTWSSLVLLLVPAFYF